LGRQRGQLADLFAHLLRRAGDREHGQAVDVAQLALAGPGFRVAEGLSARGLASAEPGNKPEQKETEWPHRLSPHGVDGWLCPIIQSSAVRPSSICSPETLATAQRRQVFLCVFAALRELLGVARRQTP